MVDRNIFKKKVLALMIILISLEAFAYEEIYVIGFGSCITEKREQPIWNSIEKEDLDEFFFMGDNVYGDNPEDGTLENMKEAYSIQQNLFPDWLENIEINAIWDDHDYGLNDGGYEYIYKDESQKLFIEFWKIDQNDPRREREGIYFSKTKNIYGKKVNLIGLDTRFHRSLLDQNDKPYSPTSNDTSKTMLGETQWLWLENQISKKADFNIIVSSIQVLATNHGFEKWENFPHERERLLTLISRSEIPTLIVSGDRHKAGIYKKGDLIELTSSSMNKPIPRYISGVWDLFFKETDKLLICLLYTSPSPRDS